jgi:hypothetical protein
MPHKKERPRQGPPFKASFLHNELAESFQAKSTSVKGDESGFTRASVKRLLLLARQVDVITALEVEFLLVLLGLGNA